MQNFKIYTDATCNDLLTFKVDAKLRELYNGKTFDYTEAKFLTDSIGSEIKTGKISLEPRPSDDFENSKKIFTLLKDLDLVQANDRRIWVSLTHTYFFEYTKSRWGVTASTSDDAIKDRFHFEGSGLRARNQNAIARLWWAARLTYDANRKDPFELTGVLLEKQDFYQNLIDRKLSTYKDALNGFLEFYRKNNQIDLKFEMRKLFKGMNAIGGVRILAALNQAEVLDQLYRLCQFYNIKYNRV